MALRQSAGEPAVPPSDCLAELAFCCFQASSFGLWSLVQSLILREAAVSIPLILFFAFLSFEEEVEYVLHGLELQD
jgi:hypothetical protein